MHLNTPNANPSGANYREIFADLRSQLPPLPDEAPEARTRREQRAMDAVADLTPYDAFEARLAVRVVATDAHAADALRAAASPPASPTPCASAAPRPRRCHASPMPRCALCCASRPGATSRRPRCTLRPWRRRATGSNRSRCRRHLPRPRRRRTRPSRSAPRPEAKLYAIMYPDRAARIRAAGGLPARLDFGPPEQEIVAALLRTRPLAPPVTATASPVEHNPEIRDYETSARPALRR
jgi:hypothetical protein